MEGRISSTVDVSNLCSGVGVFEVSARRLIFAPGARPAVGDVGAFLALCLPFVSVLTVARRVAILPGAGRSLVVPGFSSPHSSIVTLAPLQRMHLLSVYFFRHLRSRRLQRLHYYISISQHDAGRCKIRTRESPKRSSAPCATCESSHILLSKSHWRAAKTRLSILTMASSSPIPHL